MNDNDRRIAESGMAILREVSSHVEEEAPAEQNGSPDNRLSPALVASISAGIERLVVEPSEPVGFGEPEGRRRGMRRHPIADLSFVADRDGKTLPRPIGDQPPRCFWNVTPTGDTWRDAKIGRALALEYLALEEADTDGPGYLGMIVSDMPRSLTAIEIGFLTMVAYAASADADRTREIAAYWEEQSALRCRHDSG